MSKVKIKGNASGTGVLTIEAPNTNTDSTITLPDGDVTLGVGIDDNATSTAITIDSSENVGIGTSSPDSAIHIYKQTNDRSARFQRLSTQYIDVTQTSGVNEIKSTGKGFEIGTTDAQNIKFDTNGSERMRIDSDGAVTMPYQPAFRADGVGGWTPWTASSASKVTFLTNISENRGNHFSSGRFTAPIDGLYYFDSGLYRNSTAGMCQLFLMKNGGTNVGYNLDNRTPGGDATTHVSISLPLSANDYVEMHVRAPGNIYGGYSHTFFSGHLIG